MNQYPVTVRWDGYLRGPIYHYKSRIFGSIEEFSDVDMRMTLCPIVIAIEGQAPLVAPESLSFGDRRGPIGCALRRRHVAQMLQSGAVEPGQSEPAIRLGGVAIFDHKELRLGWLSVGDPAEAALAGGQRFRFGDVAGADWRAGAGEQTEQRNVTQKEEQHDRQRTI